MLNINKLSKGVRFSRPEAQTFDYNRLTDSQKAAVERILNILKEAQAELNNHKNEKYPIDDFPGLFSVPEKNSSRVLLLSGGRGSGKTSVLYSLLKFLHDRDEKCDERENSDESPDCNKKSKDSKKKEQEFLKKCHEVNKRFIWLQPLEMETLPQSTNLLAAILNRIDEAVCRFRGPHPKTHQSPSAYSPYQLNHDEHDVMLAFSELQKDVALAWDGNIEKRAANVDPDLYAVEVLRAEHKRLKLNDRIKECLDNLHKLFIKPCTRGSEHLFVLPIDDFDLNPHRCLELIQLIRILNVPRLFTFILGDIWLIRNFMNFKYFQSIETSGANQGSILSNIRYDECELAHNLSGGANRKLFVPANIISLKRMESNEVYEFRPTANAENKLEDYLEAIELNDINTAYCEEEEKTYCFGNLKIKKQHDLFNQNVNKLIEDEKHESEEGNKEEYFYIRNVLYKLFPRHAQDLCLKLAQDARDFSLKTENDNEQNYLTHAKRIYKARIRQERGLTTRSSIFLNGILQKNFEGNHRLDSSAIDLVYTYGQPLVFQNSKTAIKIVNPEDWYVKLTHPLKSSGTQGVTEEVILNEQTAAALIFVHDLLAFSNPTRIVGDNLLLKNGPPLWAYTQWPFGSDDRPIKVPWHFPPWQTMFECDLLRKCWNRVWKWSADFTKKTENNADDILANVLVYFWLRIITNILSGPNYCLKIHLPKYSKKVQQKYSLEAHEKERDDHLEYIKWYDLLTHIKGLYPKKEYDTKKREEVIHGWFTAIGCMLAPETNIPEDIRKFFAGQEDIEKILINPIIAGGIRKLRARSAVLFFDNGALNLLIDLFEPKTKADLKSNELDDKDEDVEYSEKDFINKIGKNCLCPFIEDIVMLSKLNYKNKNFFKEKLEELIIP